LCDEGCGATFTAEDITVTHDDITVLHGIRDNDTRLWTVPITVRTTPNPDTEPVLSNTALAVNHHSKTAELVAWAHAALFSPTLSTLQAAIAQKFNPRFARPHLDVATAASSVLGGHHLRPS
jgi:hypothetical protein